MWKTTLLCILGVVTIEKRRFSFMAFSVTIKAKKENKSNISSDYNQVIFSHDKLNLKWSMMNQSHFEYKIELHWFCTI